MTTDFLFGLTRSLLSFLKNKICGHLLNLCHLCAMILPYFISRRKLYKHFTSKAFAIVYVFRRLRLAAAEVVQEAVHPGVILGAEVHADGEVQPAHPFAADGGIDRQQLSVAARLAVIALHLQVRDRPPQELFDVETQALHRARKFLVHRRIVAVRVLVRVVRLRLVHVHDRLQFAVFNRDVRELRFCFTDI